MGLIQRRSINILKQVVRFVASRQTFGPSEPGIQIELVKQPRSPPLQSPSPQSPPEFSHVCGLCACASRHISNHIYVQSNCTWLQFLCIATIIGSFKNNLKTKIRYTIASIGVGVIQRSQGNITIKIDKKKKNHQKQPKNSLQKKYMYRSDDCASETSSIFDRIRRRDSNIPGLKGLRPKKINKISISQSDDALTTSTQLYSTNSDPAVTTTKKPVIAKWKAGVKVQVTERAENQDEFLEGLKRAQCARLEDQRGTEINFELPDFLKNKENQSAANKLRKIRANLSPVNKSAPVVLVDNQQQQVDRPLPQPAPRLSITKKQSISPMKIDEEDAAAPSISVVGQTIDEDSLSTKGPPPLPPKPKVLPIKPSNWGQSSTITNGCSKQVGSSSSPTTGLAIPLPSKIPVDISRKHLGSEQTGRTAYLDEPSSSFV